MISGGIKEGGYVIESVNKKAGTILERRINKYDSTMLFEMTSNYYFCKTNGEQRKQEVNTKILKSKIKNAITNRWVYRELFVLNKLKN
ncbi:MAG: hypothetical protein U9N10_01005 [Bacillota bacterium]|nr:hypothetical protein [Bacillota bacterium]